MGGPRIESEGPADLDRLLRWIRPAVARSVAALGIVGSILVFLHGSFIALGFSLGGGPTAGYGVRLGERLVLLAGAAFIMGLVGLIGTAGTRKTDPHTWRRWALLAALLSVGLLLVAELLAFWAFVGRYGPEQRAVDSFRPPPGGRYLEQHRIGGEQPEILRLWLYPEEPEADIDDEAREALKRWSCTGRLDEGTYDTARCRNHKAEIDVRTTTSYGGGMILYLRVTRIR